MKTAYGKLAFICVLSALCGTALAQITITATDVNAYLAPGNNVVNNKDTAAISANIGAPGPSSWDFSGLLAHTQTTLQSFTASSTPFTADFPGATYALKTSLSGLFAGFPGAVSGDLYVYVTVGASLLNPGNKGSGTITIIFLGNPVILPGDLTIANVPSDTTYALPMTLGTTWGSTFTSTQTIRVSGSVFGTPTVTNHALSYVVDAFGLMKMPDAQFYDALRIRTVERAGTKSIGYIFVAKNGASVALTASDTLQPDNGVIQIQRKSVTWSPPVNIPVPIQLSAFDGSWDERQSHVQLRWTTLSEVNSFGFEVQKASEQKGEFQSLPGGFIQGHGTTVAPHYYAFVDVNASRGTWYYRLKQTDLDGAFHFTEAVRVDVPAASEKPVAYSLNQNYPNPFNPGTVIEYDVPEESSVHLKVYNALGQVAATLVDGIQEAGHKSIRFDASELASGVYMYKLQAGSFVATKKMIVMK